MSIKEHFESLDYGPAPEATEHAEAWLAARDRTLLHFIDGQVRAGFVNTGVETTRQGTEFDRGVVSAIFALA